MRALAAHDCVEHVFMQAECIAKLCSVLRMLPLDVQLLCPLYLTDFACRALGQKFQPWAGECCGL
jgi:hypothetical protein